MRSILLYGAETWPLTSRLIDVLHRCDRKMLRYIVGVRWQDGRSSSEVAGMVELKAFLLRQRRPRWFGHGKKADRGLLGDVVEVGVGGQRLPGRPRKKWNECVIEDMNLLGVEEHAVQDRRMWKAVITHPTPS